MVITYAKLLAVHTRCCIDGGLPVAVAGLDTPSVGGEKPRGIGRVTCAQVSLTVAHSPTIPLPARSNVKVCTFDCSTVPVLSVMLALSSNTLFGEASPSSEGSSPLGEKGVAPAPRLGPKLNAQLTTAKLCAIWSELLPIGRNWLPGVHTALVLRYSLSPCFTDMPTALHDMPPVCVRVLAILTEPVRLPVKAAERVALMIHVTGLASVTAIVTCVGTTDAARPHV